VAWRGVEAIPPRLCYRSHTSSGEKAVRCAPVHAVGEHSVSQVSNDAVVWYAV